MRVNYAFFILQVFNCDKSRMCSLLALGNNEREVDLYVDINTRELTISKGLVNHLDFTAQLNAFIDSKMEEIEYGFWEISDEAIELAVENILGVNG